MNRNSLLVALVVLTAAMQVVILYRQPQPPAVPPRIVDAPKDFYFDLTGFPVRGSDVAKTVVMEFSDYECPFCARHATTVLPELINSFVDSGQVRYALANNPLPMHPNAKPFAAVAMCAGEQGRYWEMHDGLFASTPEARATTAALAEHAQLNSSTLEQCVENRKAEHEQVIKRDQAL